MLAVLCLHPKHKLIISLGKPYVKVRVHTIASSLLIVNMHVQVTQPFVEGWAGLFDMTHRGLAANIEPTATVLRRAGMQCLQCLQLQHWSPSWCKPVSWHTSSHMVADQHDNTYISVRWSCWHHLLCMFSVHTQPPTCASTLTGLPRGMAAPKTFISAQLSTLFLNVTTSLECVTGCATS